MEARFADVPEDLWRIVEPILPPAPSHARGGRPRISDRRILAGIVYRLRTGCQWKALPRQFAAGSTCHHRFTEWCRAGVFHRIFAAAVTFYNVRRGVQWAWASLDSAMVKAPKGGPDGAQSSRSRQTWRQAPHLDRRSGRSPGRDDHRRQRARQVDGRANARRGRAALRSRAATA